MCSCLCACCSQLLFSEPVISHLIIILLYINIYIGITDFSGKFQADFNQYICPAPIQAKSITFYHVTSKAEMVFRGKLQLEMNTHTHAFSCSFGQKASPFNRTQRFALRMNYMPHLHELQVFIWMSQSRYNGLKNVIIPVWDYKQQTLASLHRVSKSL